METIHKRPSGPGPRSNGSSRTTSVNSLASFPEEGKRLFVSYRLNGAYEKPWVTDPKMKRVRYGNYIVYSFLVLGFVGAAAIAFLITKPAVSGPVSKASVI